MRFASLGSGSGGNASVVGAGGMHLLVDCGFSLREVKKRLQRLDLDVTQIQAVLVTHEHSDHCKGVPMLARQMGIPVYATRGTYDAMRGVDGLTRFCAIEPNSRFQLGALQVRAVPVPHDARQPVQFTFEHGGLKLGLLTDLGQATPVVIEAFNGCHGLLLEANYDAQMLASGPYPYFLKARVAGALGHLSNDQAVTLLQSLETAHLQHLVLGHLSRKNNDPSLARLAIARLDKPLGQIHYACQDDGFGWLTLL